MLVGLLCALATAFAYGAATILQAVGVQRSGDDGLAGLGRQPLYLLGLALDGLGFVATVIALHFLPLFLVQSIAAGSTGVTAGVAAAMGIKLSRSGWIALLAAAVGLVLLSISADSGSGIQLPVGWRWFLLAVTVPLLVEMALGSRVRFNSWVLALGAGSGFAVVAIASRTLNVAEPIGRTLQDPALWAIAGCGLAGTALFASALARGSATAVAAIASSTDTVIPAAVGLVFLGDSVRSGFAPVAAVGFLLAVSGAIALARFAELGPVDFGSRSGESQTVEVS